MSEQPTIKTNHERGTLDSRVLALSWVLILTALTYLPVIQFGFIAVDDNIYIFNKSHVTEGLTWSTIRWAFTSIEFNWHPLT